MVRFIATRGVLCQKLPKASVLPQFGRVACITHYILYTLYCLYAAENTTMYVRYFCTVLLYMLENTIEVSSLTHHATRYPNSMYISGAIWQLTNKYKL